MQDLNHLGQILQPFAPKKEETPMKTVLSRRENSERKAFKDALTKVLMDYMNEGDVANVSIKINSNGESHTVVVGDLTKVDPFEVFKDSLIKFDRKVGNNLLNFLSDSRNVMDVYADRQSGKTTALVNLALRSFKDKSKHCVLIACIDDTQCRVVAEKLETGIKTTNLDIGYTVIDNFIFVHYGISHTTFGGFVPSHCNYVDMLLVDDTDFHNKTGWQVINYYSSNAKTKLVKFYASRDRIKDSIFGRKNPFN